MDNNKLKPYGENKINWNILVLIAVVILIGVSAAVIYEYKTILSERSSGIDPLSETGKRLTNVAEKALENEGIETEYLLLRSIVKYPPDSIIVRFIETNTFSNAKIYSNHNITDKEVSSVFAADLDRYDIATYFTKDKQVKVYDKNARVESEIWGYGENYTLKTTANTLEIIDEKTNKVMLKILNYNVIQNEEQTEAISTVINSKFELAQQNPSLEFYIDSGEPFIIIDTPGSNKTGDLFVEVAFYKNQITAIHIEETSKISDGTWGGSKIEDKVKYF